MNTKRDRLNFVLQLAKMDLDTLREGDKLNLRDDMIAFFNTPDLGGVTRWLQQNLDLSHIREMQEDARDILDSLIAGILWFKNEGEHDLQSVKAIPRKSPKGLDLSSYTDDDGKPLRHRAQIKVTGTIVLDFLEPGSLQANLVGFSDAEIRTAFRLKLISTIAAVGVPALRRCPECNLVFVAKHGKKKFCSDRCNDRTADRKYREGHRPVLAERAQRFYKQKTEAKSGGKVQRRERVK